MRKRDWVTQRLDSWGWHWAAKIERGGSPPWPVGTLGRDGVGGGVPGPQCPLHPADWMRPDCLNTHLCVMKLATIYRDVVTLQYVYPERPVKVNCAELGIASSVYYWRLTGAHRKVAHDMRHGVELENVQLEAQTLRV